MLSTKGLKMRDLWVEKYRPTSVDQYVFTDDSTKQQIESWIQDNSIPHLLLNGYRDWETDRKSTRLNSSHSAKSRMPSSA